MVKEEREEGRKNMGLAALVLRPLYSCVVLMKSLSLGFSFCKRASTPSLAGLVCGSAEVLEVKVPYKL